MVDKKVLVDDTSPPNTFQGAAAQENKLVVSLTSDRGLGGISASLLTYSRAMKKAGIRHIVAVPRATPVFNELAAMDNVEVIALPSAKLRAHALTRYHFASKLRRYMTDADAIFIHNAKSARMPSVFRGKTYVINHNGKTKRLNHAPNIIFLNESARKNFLEAFPTLTTHHLVMGHGFDVAEEIERESSDRKTVQIVSAGRLMEKKGYRDLIESARLLQAQNVNCHISIYGEGPDETLLRSRIAEYELTNITLNGWTNNLRDAFAKADIFCSPSHGESFSLVIGEALEAGLAIASTRTNGAREYFSYADEDKPVGLLSDIHDVEGMATILKELASNVALRQSMEKNARTLLLDNFSLDILGEKFSRLCQETKARPRIFMATQTFPPRVGGMENVMKALAEKLSFNGFNVTVLPNRSYRPLASFNVLNLRLVKPLRILVKRLTLKYLAQDEDTIICDSWKSVNVVTRQFNGRLIILAHGQEFLKGKKRMSRIQTALNRSFRVIASSEYTAALIRENYDINPTKIRVIPPTYMVEQDDATEPRPSSTTVKMISVCRLNPRKGLLQTLKALGTEALRDKDWHWTIIGSGPEALTLKSAAKELNLNEKISFLHNVNDTERDMHLRTSDLFVMPSYQIDDSVEGFGISYIEAARFGLPAIAGTSGGTMEAVKDGETGWCVDAMDGSALVQTLLGALSENSEILKRSKAAKQRFLSEFEADTVFDRFLQETELRTKASD